MRLIEKVRVSETAVSEIASALAWGGEKTCLVTIFSFVYLACPFCPVCPVCPSFPPVEISALRNVCLLIHRQFLSRSHTIQAVIWTSHHIEWRY